MGRWSSDPQHPGKIIIALGIPAARAGDMEVCGTQELAGQWKLNPGVSGSVEGPSQTYSGERLSTPNLGLCPSQGCTPET